MEHYIIVANGDFLAREIILEAVENKTIIALDGAAIRLKQRGIMPHVILGDFDSTHEAHAKYWGITQTFNELTDDTQAYTGNFGITIAPKKNQNYTDLTKAIHYCDEQQAKSITIICAMGGRLDLQESALRGFRSAHKNGRKLLLHTDQQTIRFAKDETIVMSGKVGDKCGIISYPKAKFSSHGLLYEADNFELNFGFTESTANEMKLTNATISVTGEALLIMPPQLAAQREFMQKSEVERLEMLWRDAMLSGLNTPG